MYKTNFVTSLRKARLIASMLCGCLVVFLMYAGHAGAVMDIKPNLANICFECHDTLKAKLSEKFQHFPFKQGKCAVCHSSHAASRKGLLSEASNDLCKDCHLEIKKLMANAAVHGALASGLCTDCHDPHASSIKKLMKKEEKEMCWGCHAEAKKGLDRARVHQPLKEGACSACHNPHASVEDALLVSDPAKLCKNCHQPQCKAGGVSIAAITKDKKCTSCHSGHSADAKGLLGPYAHKDFQSRNCNACHTPIVSGKPVTTKKSGKELCVTCHANVKTKANDPHLAAGKGNECSFCHDSHASRNPKLLGRTKVICASCHEMTYKRIRAMEKAFHVKCVPIRDRDCFACHVPPHATGPYYFKVADTIALCASCHTGQHRTSHPIGEKILDPRDGKPMTCLTCHKMHSAKNEFLLTHERKRQLCVQCHKGK